MADILLLYSTTDGHTRKICQRLALVIEAQGDHVMVQSIDDSGIDLHQADKIVLGASIRYGRHAKGVYEFIERNQASLESKPNAFFTVNVVARKPDKNKPDTNPYLIKFLGQISWQPQNLAVFGGRLDYRKYPFWDRLMIRLIMWMTKGPTDTQQVYEFTDWQQVEDFGHFICKME